MMTNPLDKIKKLKNRSWSEIRTRGKQTISGYAEQIGLSGNLPTDDELRKLVAKSEFSDGIITAETLFNKFYEKGKVNFFPSFFDLSRTTDVFKENFGNKSSEFFVKRAKSISDGKIDLLGFKNLNIGESVDWHYEPVSDTQSPLKHWKQFDELDTSETGDKKIIWELNRHQHFFTLGIAYSVTKDEKFAATFVRHLNSWMDQNPPGMGVNWVSSLEVSFRAISWIWAFHFFKDSLSFTPGLYQKALKYLFIHGKHLEQYLSTYYSPNTHLTGEALGLYYLGTQLSFLDCAADWREQGKEILLEELDRQILPDGVYFEQTTWYQRYTTDFYLQFLLLARLSGEEIDSNTRTVLSDKTQSLLNFLMSSTRPNGTTPIIGDDDGGRNLPLTDDATDDFSGTLAAGAVMFYREDYKFVAEKPAQEILWLFGAEGLTIFDSLGENAPKKTSEAFTDGGYFVMRDGWAETDNYLLVDAGEVGSLNGGHGHADTLSFELAAGGRPILVDSGTYTYNESKDLRDYFRSSQAHNTLTIDERSSSETGGKFSWETKAEPKVNSWLSQDRFDFFEGSHDGYNRLGETPTKHTRSILFLKNDYWIMRDFVDTLGEHSYQQNFNFDSKTSPVIKNLNGVDYISETNSRGFGLELFTFGDNGKWNRKDGWVSKCYGKRTKAALMQYVSKGVGPQEFFTFMVPNENGFEKPEVVETTVAGGRAFVVNYRDYSDLFVFADGDGQLIRTEFFNTDFRFLWARMSPGDRLPEEFVLINGNNFSLDGRVVVEDPQGLDYAIARRFGDKLYVRTPKNVFNVSLPKNKRNSYILKTDMAE